jgi:hypothetical protein
LLREQKLAEAWIPAFAGKATRDLRGTLSIFSQAVRW